MCADISSALQNLAASSATQPTLIGDVEILEKFREWCDTRRAVWVGDDEAAKDAAWNRAIDIEKALLAIPAVGVAGLMIKAYLLVHYADDGPREDAAAVSAGMPDDDERASLLKLELLRDAVRFLPELGHSARLPSREERSRDGNRWGWPKTG